MYIQKIPANERKWNLSKERINNTSIFPTSEHKSKQPLRTMLNIIFLFFTASRKSLCNTENVLGKQGFQNTTKTFSASIHKLRTTKSSSSSSNKNRECLSPMLSEAFLMQNKRRMKFKTKCLTGEKYINTPRLLASVCEHEWDQSTPRPLCMTSHNHGSEKELTEDIIIIYYLIETCLHSQGRD